MAWQEQRTLARHTAYVNLVFEYGDVSPKERIGQVLAPEKKRAVYVPKLAVGPEQEIATPCDAEGCDSMKLAPAVGLEPTTWWLTATRSAN